MTYDFARQLSGATEVTTSGFADALVAKITGAAEDLARFEESRRLAIKRQRKEREAKRVIDPVQAMRDSGRQPNTASGIMSKVLAIGADESVETAMQIMTDKKVSSILVKPGADGQWGIMTQRDVVEKIVGANRSRDGVKVREIASKPIVTVTADTNISHPTLKTLWRRSAGTRFETPVRILGQSGPVGELCAGIGDDSPKKRLVARLSRRHRTAIRRDSRRE